ncbi:MAG TPA: sigma-70 family RNA polymerase sigma factor [Clostridia bacterium]|nr:sigma-70 family RNA polymerase sigma factor [Clostridia bacterium]
MSADWLSADRLRRARAGDGPAFAELLAPVLDPAFRLAMTMLTDRTAAEDAVQEAALKSWRKLDSFRYGADLRPWFLAIVANECRSARRSRWWQVIRSDDVATLKRTVVPERAWADRIDLDAALHRLPKHHLLALTLYYHLDLPIEEVARVFECSVGAAKQRIHRALAALRIGMSVEVAG